MSKPAKISRPKYFVNATNISEVSESSLLTTIAAWGDSKPEKCFVSHVKHWTFWKKGTVDVYAQVSLDGRLSYDFALVFKDRWVMLELDSRRSNKANFEQKNADALKHGFFVVRVPAVACVKRQNCLDLLEWARCKTLERSGDLCVLRSPGYAKAVIGKKRFRLKKASHTFIEESE